MKTKYIIISLSLIAFMGFWMIGGVLLNSGIHPMGILGIPLFIIQSFQDQEEIDELTYMSSDKPLQRVLDHCEIQRKLATGEIPERNADGSENGIDHIYLIYQNDTHYIDNNKCEWEEKPLKIQVCRGGCGDNTVLLNFTNTNPNFANTTQVINPKHEPILRHNTCN